VSTGQASSSGADRWVRASARAVGIVVSTVFMVLLVPGEAWGVTAEQGSLGRVYMSDLEVAITGAENHQIGIGEISVTHTVTLAGSVQAVVYCYRPGTSAPVPTDNTSFDAPAGFAGGGTNLSQTWNGGSNGTITSNPQLATCPVLSSPTERSVPKLLRISTTNSGDTPRVSWYSLTAAPSTCTTQWSGLWASADGATIKVRFDWTGATKPVGGWRVESADGATLYGTIPRRVMDGTLETQGVNITSAAVPTTLRIEAADSSSCYATVSTGVTQEDTFVDDGSNECSFGDVACYFRSGLNWAFMPEQTTLDQFSGLGEDIGSKIPFVYVVGAADLASITFSSGEGSILYSYDGLFRFPCDMGMLNICETGTYYHVMGPSDPIVEWMRDKRTPLSVFMWLLLLVPLSLWVWRRLFPVVGSGGQ